MASSHWRQDPIRVFGVTRAGEGQPRPLHLARQLLDGGTTPGEDLHGRLVDVPNTKELQCMT